MDYIRVFDDIFSRFTKPKFAIKFWDGQTREYGYGDSPSFTLTISDQLTAQKLLARGSIGFGEAYMQEQVLIDGNLEEYLKLRYQTKRLRPSLRIATAAFLSRLKVPRHRKDQISQHYDIGNDFFKLILDGATMSYSSGRYEAGSHDLEKAQQLKLELIAGWLALPANSTILDIGAGWGGFAMLATTKYNWRVTGSTLSHKQLEYCQDLAQKQHFSDRAIFEYRDMITDLPKIQYDGVVLIESIEHVGQKNLPAFFRQLKETLKPGAPLVIQTSGRYIPKPLDSWTLKYVFPGGYLPAKNELLDAARGAGLILEEFRDDTPDYLETMSAWINNLEKHRAQIEREFGRPFYRTWELWMHGAHAGFEVGTMKLFRLRLRRPEV